MDADGVKVLHRADGDNIALAVAHDLKFDLLPAGDALFDQHLRDGRKLQTVGGDLDQFFFVADDTAAGTAEGKGRTDDDRITDLSREFERGIHIVDDCGGNDRLADLQHGILEHLAVLRLVDGVGSCAQQLDAVLFQKAFLGELHGERQTCLTAQRGQQAVGTLLADDALDGFERQRLDVDLVRHGVVGHDRRRVGVDQNDLQSLLLEGAARLCACIVKFSSLSDNDRTGADHHYSFDILFQWHIINPFSIEYSIQKSVRSVTCFL